MDDHSEIQRSLGRIEGKFDAFTRESLFNQQEAKDWHKSHQDSDDKHFAEMRDRLESLELSEQYRKGKATAYSILGGGLTVLVWEYIRQKLGM